MQGAGTYSAKDVTPVNSIIVLLESMRRYPPILLVIAQANDEQKPVLLLLSSLSSLFANVRVFFLAIIHLALTGISDLRLLGIPAS